MRMILRSLFARESMSREEACAAMVSVLDPTTAPEQVAAFLAALSAKGETADEISGFLAAIRARSPETVVAPVGTMDTCGTGGDHSATFNISTASALILAAGGVPVAKHGNRSVSSRCGSADVIEALGISLEANSAQSAQVLQREGFCFLFAPRFHPALKAVGPVRRALGVRTVFNLLGPLLNPAQVKRQVVGVFDDRLCGTLAEVLRQAGCEEAMVVSSQSGMDELSLHEPSRIAHLQHGKIRQFDFNPAELGVYRTDRESLLGGDAAQNAAIIRQVLGGQARGAREDIVALNAAAGFVVAGNALDLADGLARARALLRSGAALRLVERLARLAC